MWWEKKPQKGGRTTSSVVPVPPLTPKLDGPIMETTPRESDSKATLQNHTVLGRSVVLRGELSAGENLLIEGQFEGNIKIQEHCLSVGTQGQVKAEIHARQVVVHGSVTGNVSAREKIEIHKTGHIEGDLRAAAVAIEEGAYFKGSIEIVREEAPGPARPASPPKTVEGNS